MPVTLDLMEYANDGLAQAAYPSSDHTWDLLDEDCSDISDWIDEDHDTGVSEVDPAGQFRFDTNAGAAGNAYAMRYRIINSPPDKFVVEIKTYFDSIGTHGQIDYVRFLYTTSTWRFRVFFASDGLYITKTGNVAVEVGTDIVKHGGSAAWQTWRFEVDKSGGEAAATVEVFLDDVSQGTVDCDYEAAATDGRIEFVQLGYATNNMVSHVDYIRVVTGVSSAPHLQCYSEDTIVQQGTYSLKAIAKKTDAFNDTLTRTVDPMVDLSGLPRWYLYLRASRTGSNIKIGIHDSGGVTTEVTPNIASANVWQAVEVDLSGVADVDKDAIDSIIITIVNADADCVFYLDDMYGELIIVSRERNIVYDSILELSKTRDIVYDSVLELSRTRDIVYDSVLELSRERNIVYDSVLEVSKTRNILYDSILELSRERNILYDLVLELSRERNIFYDSVLEVSRERSILYDLFELIQRLEAPTGVPVRQAAPTNGAVKQVRPTGTWIKQDKPS